MHTFQNIRAGDRVRYRTPQGQTHCARACAMLLFPEHAVLVGPRGRAIVCNASNYISHRRAPTRRAAVTLED
jgi:hypothetical protein